MVGKIQGTGGETGGEATTVIIIMNLGPRWDLQYSLRSNSLCRLVVLCICVSRNRKHNLLAGNYEHRAAKYLHSIPESG